jgi:hypothetical protein
MLFSMLRHRTQVRVLIALIAVFALVIAGPLHAAHHHDDGRLHAPCAVCQLHSPACQQPLVPGGNVSLEPIFTLSLVSVPSLQSASVTIADTRAPPFFLA